VDQCLPRLSRLGLRLVRLVRSVDKFLPRLSGPTLQPPDKGPTNKQIEEGANGGGVLKRMTTQNRQDRPFQQLGAQSPRCLWT